MVVIEGQRYTDNAGNVRRVDTIDMKKKKVTYTCLEGRGAAKNLQHTCSVRTFQTFAVRDVSDD